MVPQAHLKSGCLIMLWNRPWQIPTINTGPSREMAIVVGEVRLTGNPRMMNVVKLNFPKLWPLDFLRPCLIPTIVMRSHARPLG